MAVVEREIARMEFMQLCLRAWKTHCREADRERRARYRLVSRNSIRKLTRTPSSASPKTRSPLDGRKSPSLYDLSTKAREMSAAATAKRILFASSNHVIGFHARETRLTASSPIRPDSNYGVSKAYGEALARMYWDKYGIETLILRIGSCFPEPKDRRMLATWMSSADMLRLLRAQWVRYVALRRRHLVRPLAVAGARPGVDDVAALPRPDDDHLGARRQRTIRERGGRRHGASGIPTPAAAGTSPRTTRVG